MQIALIGCGNIGEAVASSILEAGIVTPSHLYVVEKDPSRVSQLQKNLKSVVSKTLVPQIASCELIILCVKPQDFGSLATELKGSLSPNSLVISVMAGITLDTLNKALSGHTRLIRCMPNLPLRVGRGMTVYCAADAVSHEQRLLAEAIFNATGKSLSLASEDLLNAATAISGTGPAYLFFMIEKLIDVSLALGFSTEDAELLVYQTFRGALKLWHDGSESPEALRAMVTSKGGTTEAAFKVLNENAFGETFVKAVKRAAERSKELAT